MIQFSYGRIGSLQKELEDLSFFVNKIEERMSQKQGPGHEFLGWLDLPETSLEKSREIKKLAEETKNRCDVLVVIGIGGSYLGTRAVWEALRPYYGPIKNAPELLFLGTDLSGEKIEQTLAYLENKEFCVNVISKSGTTLEPSVAFAYLYEYLKQRYGSDIKKRLIITTDEHKGALRPLAKEGFPSFIVPDDVGGRYSVFTAVGLFPLAVAGVDIEFLLQGAKDAMEDCNHMGEKSLAAQYAKARHIFRETGKEIEILGTFEPKLKVVGDWYVQLFGESEGKEGKGLYPTSLLYTTDLHSMGQWIQEGKRTIFETFLVVREEPKHHFGSFWDLIGLKGLENVSVEEMNQAAFEGTKEAHEKGGVPVLVWTLEKQDAYHIGGLLYYFQRACALSAHLSKVNPFNQPGVEEYKKRMFALLKNKRIW